MAARKTSGKKKVWKRDQWRDGREIIQHVILQRINSAVQHVVPKKTQVNRVAVGLSAGSPAGANGAVRAADYFR
jgi:hypothetical protein